MSDLSIIRSGAHYYLSADPTVQAASLVVTALTPDVAEAFGFSVVPERDDHNMTTICEGCGSTNVETSKQYLGSGRYWIATRCDDCGTIEEGED